MKVEKNRVTKNNEYCRQLYIVLQLMQNQELKDSIMVIFPPKRLFCCKHCFLGSTCKTVPKFNYNLRTQFNEGKEDLGGRIVKTFEYENTRSHVKKF